MRILVTGASGLIGRQFILQALKEGHDVRALVRTPESFQMLRAKDVYKWDHTKPLSPGILEGIDAIVNLAGENIADKRWTSSRKKQLVESRVQGTRRIVEALRSIPEEKRPKTFVSGSAIGFYGYDRDEELNEDATAGDDFLAKLCVDWEKEAQDAESLGLRVVLTRTGIVLSKRGGALAKMPPVRLSDGQSWMSWIHIEDMANALLYILKTETISGPVNCVAPNPVRNAEFVKILAAKYGVPSIAFAPRPVLAMALGELSRALISSLKVNPSVLTKHGFRFRYPDLGAALECELYDAHPLDRVFSREQFVPLAPEKVFPFFSRAENLETLTPPWLNFRIVSKSTEHIEKGTLIDYKLKIHGTPVKWRTKITEWKKNEYFIDEQLKGPYTKWHHLHTFERVPGGCVLRDEVTYRIPGSIFGSTLLSSWISNDVSRIFSFRQLRIRDLIAKGELT